MSKDREFVRILRAEYAVAKTYGRGGIKIFFSITTKIFRKTERTIRNWVEK